MHEITTFGNTARKENNSGPTGRINRNKQNNAERIWEREKDAESGAAGENSHGIGHEDVRSLRKWLQMM